MDRRSARRAGLAAVAAAFGVWGIGDGVAQAQPAAVTGFGSVTSYGSPSGLAAPVAGMAATTDARGYWLVGADGGVFTYGDARFAGSGSGGLGIPVVGIAASHDDGGYWIVNDLGSVQGFGDAPSIGDLPDSEVTSAAPVVGIVADPVANGYWLVGADGGVFSFGAAKFHGSLGGVRLSAPIVGMAATPDGGGYWLVGADGGVFSFGNAVFHGSLGGVQLSKPIVGLAALYGGGGYWLAGADGGVFTFGGPFMGSEGRDPAPATTPVVAIASSPIGPGYWLTTSDRALPPAGSVPAVDAECDQYVPSAQVKPSSIVLACGDGNASLTQMHWSSWTAAGAVGTGEFTHNLCQPDCAQGTFVSDPTQVSLSYPVESGAGPEFASVTFTDGGQVVTQSLEVSPVG